MTQSNVITSLDDLAKIYGPINKNSLVKETTELTLEYQRWIEASPFFALASSGSGGLDCSPRGDKKGKAFDILSNTCLAIPDRRGNNRIDTLKNIVEDPRVALMFLIPGINEALH